ncbi:hypothetical protein AB1Y20_004079 [Prymnesium parvum]|uniref:Apple domain-containing protein n=1 Tax=Prymnesium parvum TaxID=97485 RepID=A0AB34J6K7_PRYPA
MPRTHLLLSLLALRAAAARGVVPCTETRKRKCCGDDVCEGPEDMNNCLADCPGITTDATCGEEPHSDRGGRGLTFGVGFRAASAQDCCDKCKEHARKNPTPGPCNSWTFCGLPVCWGLDTGWNHTFGECWLRFFEDPSKPTFGQRGALSAEYRRKFLHTRRACVDDQPGGMSPGWACPPTHVPWTSGSIGGPPLDLKTKWETSGGWGNMRVHRLDEAGKPIVETCTKNGGQPC